MKISRNGRLLGDIEKKSVVYVDMDGYNDWRNGIAFIDPQMIKPYERVSDNALIDLDYVLQHHPQALEIFSGLVVQNVRSDGDICGFDVCDDDKTYTFVFSFSGHLYKHCKDSPLGIQLAAKILGGQTLDS